MLGNLVTAVTFMYLILCLATLGVLMIFVWGIKNDN